MDKPLDLMGTTPTVPSNKQISLFPVGNVPYSADHTNDLAAKYDIAMGDVSPGENAVRDALMQGNTARYGELLAQRKAVDVQNARNAVVQQIVQQSGGNPSPYDVEIVRGLSEEQLYSPDVGSILEEEYSRKLTELQTVLTDEDTGNYEESSSIDPEGTAEVMDRSQYQGARNMVAMNALDSLKKKADEAGLLGGALAWGQQLIPFRSWAAMNTMIADAPGNSFLPGDTLEKNYAYLNTLPPGELKSTLDAAVAKQMETGNYLDAISFVQGFLSYSESDKNWANVWAGVDVAGVLPLGVFAKSVKGAARAVNAGAKDLKAISVAAELPAEAAGVELRSSLTNRLLPSQDIKNVNEVEKLVMSISRPSELFAGRDLRAGGAALGRLEIAAQARAGKAMEIITNVNRVERLTPAEVEKGFDEAKDWLVNNYVHANHQIVDVQRNMAENNIGNIYSVDVFIGKADGSVFSNKLSAQKAAKQISLRTEDFQVVERNGGFAVKVSRNVDENSDGIRALEIETDYKNPDNFVTRFLGYGVGADVKLSKGQQLARGVAVQSTEHMGALMESFTTPIRNLSKKERGNFEKFLIRARDHVDPKKGRGITYSNVFEFEDAWHSQYGRLPSFAETDAYMAFKQAYDFDYLIRDLDVYKQKSIMGVEKFSMKVGDQQLEFEGKEIPQLPRGSKTPFQIVVVDDAGNAQRGTTLYSRYMGEKEWANVDALLKDNYKVIQSFNGSQEVAGEMANFILVRHFNRSRAGMMNLNYKEGSRVISKYPFYGKQARVKNSNGLARYNGDQTLFNARSEAEAKEIADHVNVALKMVKNRTPGIKRYIAENLPMWNLRKFYTAIKEGTISVDSPVLVTRSGSRTLDQHNVADALRKEGQTINQFVTDDEFDLSRQVNGRFLGERDETNMAVYGTEKGSVFEMDGDGLLSPLEALRTSMSNMVDTHIVHDYRIRSVRDYIKNYSNLLDGDKSTFDTEGLSYIFNPRYRTGADPNQVRNAEGVRTSILSLFNNKTFVERQVDMYKEKIIGSIRQKFGEGVGDWVQDVGFEKISNLDTKMRAFAFHTKMGMFNIKQLFLQSTGMINIMSISPVHGIKGARSISPLVMAMSSETRYAKAIAKKLPMAGFKPDEFEELVKMYKRSGFYHVSGDVAALDNLKPPSLRKSKFGQALEFGALPFRAGEGIARSMAFATAYSERKAFAASRALSRADEAWVLKRAKDLTGNMTRDSNAAYQKGYAAVVTQFMGYQMRLMEQMTGLSGKLTRWERARLFTGMALMFGVPVSAGMTVGVVPVREWLKDSLASEGYSYDNTLAEPFMDGFASTILEQMTGMDLNVSEKYGPGGISTFGDMFKQDADWAELVMGASGGVVAETIKDVNPAIQFIHDLLDLNPNTNFTLNVNDLIEPLRSISTVNNFVKLNEAINTGRWLSQNETYLTNVDLKEAYTSAIFGLDPERVSDSFNQLDALSARKEMQTSAKKEMVTNYKRGVNLLREGNQKDAMVFFERVRAKGILAGMSQSQMMDMYKQAASEMPLDESVMQSFEKFIVNNKKRQN